MRVILTRTWENLRNNWVLFLPVIVFSTFLRLLGLIETEVTGLYFISIFLLDRAMKAGWLNQMKQIVLTPERKTNLNDFYEGVAKYFWTIVAGSFAYLFVALLLLTTTIFVADSIMGEVNPDQLQELVKSVTQPSPAVSIEPSSAPTATTDASHLFKWLSVVLVGILIILGLGAVIFFWPQYTVFKNEPWFQAWQDSQQIVFRHWAGCLYLGVFWMIPTVLIFLCLIFASPALALIAYFLDIFLKTFFTLMFCQFVLMADPQQFISQLPQDKVNISEEAKEMSKTTDPHLDSFTLSEESKKKLDDEKKKQDKDKE